MTLKETSQVIDLLVLAYPKFAKNLSDDKRIETAKLWAAMFADDDLMIVLAAIKALIATKVDDWPPTIGAVKDRIAYITSPADMTEQEAWALVSNAVRHTEWSNPSKQFDTLPYDVQRALGSPKTLIEWGMVEEDTFATVVASNFQRSYRARKHADRELSMLPPDVRNIVGEISGSMTPLSIAERNGDKL